MFKLVILQNRFILVRAHGINDTDDEKYTKPHNSETRELEDTTELASQPCFQPNFIHKTNTRYSLSRL
jgi:hypothetical protein